MTLESPAIIERLERLERQNRHLKRCAVILLLVLSSVFLMGQAAPSSRTVEAQKFVLVDSGGNVRAELIILPSGLPGLRFLDTKGGIESLVTGGGLAMFDGQVNTANLYHSGLVIQSLAGERTISLGGYSGATPPPRGYSPPAALIGLYGSSGKTRLELTAEEAGPTLSMSDTEGFSAHLGRTDLQTPRTGEDLKTSAASLVLFDKTGTVIWRAP